MKRIAIIVVMVMMSLAASASSIRYFTYAQAARSVQYLNAQQEMMLYCGYDYEIETYVLVNEVWMERVNSAYYELWLYGYDAYTGDEIYMPLDLECVWLYSAGRMYNAAQYLRFHATVHTPKFAWYIPPYNPYTRRVHVAGYVRSYHYDIHRHGWRPPTPPHHGWGPHTQPPLPPYYMRHPQTPAPVPAGSWTPGMEHPRVNNSNANSGTRSTGVVPTTRPSASGAATPGTSATRSGSSRSNTNNNSGTTTTTTRSTGNTTTTRSTGTTPTRSNTGTSRTSDNAAGTTTTRSGSASSTTTRSTGTSTTTTRSAGTTNTTTTRSSGTPGATTRSTGSSTTTTRSGSGTTTRNASTGTGTSRASSTTSSRSNGTTNRR